MRTKWGNVASIFCERSSWQLLKGNSQPFLTINTGQSENGVANSNGLGLKVLYELFALRLGRFQRFLMNIHKLLQPLGEGLWQETTSCLPCPQLSREGSACLFNWEGKGQEKKHPLSAGPGQRAMRRQHPHSESFSLQPHSQEGYLHQGSQASSPRELIWIKLNW